jgi:hypothetical protein
MTTLESTLEQTVNIVATKTGATETAEPISSLMSLSLEISESAHDVNECAAKCRHCQKRKINRPRGLCWSCYYTPSVSNQYPTTSKFGRRGHGQSNQARQPDHPTSAPPGSVEKLAVLADRAKRNMALWHPLDARYPGDTRPYEQTAAA